MISNQKARELAESYVSQVKSELGDDLLMVLLFGSTIEGKLFPNDVDIFVSGKKGRPIMETEHVNVAYQRLDQIKAFVEGSGQGKPSFIRQIFMGHAKVLYDPGNYYSKINRAFASGNASYIDSCHSE